MDAEALYYETLTTNTALSAVLNGRVYPVKLPQTPTYPALMYDVEVEVDELTTVSAVRGLFSFTNTFYAASYGDIIAITKAFRDISMEKHWNIQGYVDLDFVTDKNVYARALIISVGSTI